MPNPFKPVWRTDPTEDDGGHWECSIDPNDWVRSAHPDANQFLGLHPAHGAGMLWEWGDGYVFASPDGYIETGPSIQKMEASESVNLNMVWRNRVDEFGDWVDSPTELVAVTVSGIEQDEVCVHFNDGTTITDRTDQRRVMRSQMGDDGVVSWPARIANDGVELSEHAVTYIRQRLAERDSAAGEWRWLVPDREVSDARGFVEQAVGVRL